MNLSKRLCAAADLVTAGYAVCDVGCDHAYTSIELVRSKCPYAVASDVRTGPLAAAENHVAEAALSDKIKVVLADGVPKNIVGLLPDGTPAALVITGMGGMLIMKILSDAGELLTRFDELVLSPQSDIYAVREYLASLGYVYEDEAEVLEDGKFYTLIKVRRPHAQETCHAQRCSKTELMYGPCLLAKKDETLLLYLKKREQVLKSIREKLIASGRDAGDDRVLEIDEELRSIYEAFGYYDTAQ